MEIISQTIRKLLGTVLIIALAVVYALVATTIASAKLADASALMHMLFFLVSGIAWVVPAMFLIKWMVK